MNDATDLAREVSKRAKFERLATARTKKVIKAIRVLANMGGQGRYNYEFADADVDKIAGTLADEVAKLRTTMIAPGRQLDIEFDL
ncbi:hypothetical protein NKJ06_18920 [Mesorhizobium sp. M0293]|uniref:hypothetical protein n=1 Tax=Mesorhizobium sp. M0293 TaxID=2956930 RepID=UPI00333C73D8